MSSPKTKSALKLLGQNIRGARLRRRIAVADLAVRAGTSPSSIARLERGEPGVGIGTLADVLVVLGLVERLADIIDIRKDDLGLALTVEHQPKRGRTYKTARNKSVGMPKATVDRPDDIDPDGIAF